ncbi:MAG: hypothetical protein J0L73_26375 [Verrucomicrobia bacterium]|nr:hypothetical protein [Verrucomicrobiota bacterium]
MSDSDTSTPAKANVSGCRRSLLLLAGLIVLLVITGISYLVYLEHTYQTRKFHRLDRLAVKDLKYSILTYQEEYKHFPVVESGTLGSDLLIRSRGMMLQALCGQKAGGLNPKEIKFIDLPVAKNRIRGVWLNGEESVLHDTWGEPFYIILDTNGDGKTANPEFGAEHPPETLPLKVLIYSSGPDRDPKTWKDNVCSWRPQ